MSEPVYPVPPLPPTLPAFPIHAVLSSATLSLVIAWPGIDRWPPTSSLTMASTNEPMYTSGAVVTRSSAKRAAEEDVIDVDSLQTTEVTPPSSGKGKGPAKVARFNEPIDVDNPDTWVTPSRSSAGGPSGGLASRQHVEGGTTEEGDLDNNGSVFPTGVVATAETAPVVTEARAAGKTPAAVVLPAFVAASTGADALASGASPLFGVMHGAGARARRSKLLSKAVRDGSHPRRFRSDKFTRRAAVMSVVPVSRMVADPPTPPLSGSACDGNASFSNDGSGDDYYLDAVAEAEVAEGGEKQSTDGAAADVYADHNTDMGSRLDTTEHPPPPASAWSSAPSAGATALPVGGLPTGSAPVGSTSEALASQLASLSRNPRIMTAAFWMPGAQAAHATAQASRVGLPPISPPLAVTGVPVSTTVRQAPQNTVSLPRSLPSVPETLPLVADAEDASSSDMDDDALVAAYITPPA